MDAVLWRPTGDRTRLDEFTDSVREAGGPAFDSYEDLWRWSVDDLEAFWSAVWRFVDIPADGDPSTVLASDSMPGAEWFPDVRLNYAEAMLRMPGRADDDVVVIARSQSRDEVRITAAELRDQVARARRGLVRFGVGPGDRVAAYAPEHPRDAGADAGHGQPGGRVQLVRTGVRRAERHRPLAADRAEAAPRGRRLPVRREGDQPPRRGGGHPGPAPERPHRRLAAVPGRPRDLHRRRQDLGRPRLCATREAGAAGVRAGALRQRRSTCCSRPAPPACRSRSCTATAASRSSTSRRWACRATSGPTTASSGFPPPAG